MVPLTVPKRSLNGTPEKVCRIKNELDIHVDNFYIFMIFSCGFSTKMTRAFLLQEYIIGVIRINYF